MYLTVENWACFSRLSFSAHFSLKVLVIVGETFVYLGLRSLIQTLGGQTK